MGVPEAVTLPDTDRVVPRRAGVAKKIRRDDLVADPVGVEAMHLHDPVVRRAVALVLVVRTTTAAIRADCA